MGIDATAADLTQPDGFTETLLTRLGYPAIEAMDFTDKEGAAHIHDLNKPCPDHLKGQFDIVIDGGTTEHIFYIGTALDTCHDLLAPGGLLLSYVSADGWFGHGFFQTGPDVPWRYWHHARGYQMLEVSIVARKLPGQITAIPDPTGQPRGGERALSGPHMILTAARKPLVDPPYAPPIQGHYTKG
jgi:SAM-dependent methyltransferase